MSARVAFILNLFSLRNACVLYFFIAPFLAGRVEGHITFVVYAISHLVSGFIACLAAAERLSQFSEKIVFRRTSLLFILMVAACFFSILVNTPRNLLSPGAYYYKYASIVFPVVSMFVMVNIWTLKDVPKLYSLIAAVMGIGFVAMILEVLWFWATKGTVPRVGFTLFQDPNRYAIFLNVLYGFAFSKLLDAIMRKQPVSGLVVVIGLIFLALFLTQSRGGMATCLIVTIICVVATRSRKIMACTLLAFVPVLALFLLAFAYRYQEPMGTVASDMGRVWSYMVGLNIIRDRPFLGIGLGNIVNVYDKYGPIYYMLLSRAMGIHNAMLEIFAEEGFFGFVIYMFMVFVPIVSLSKRIARISPGRYPVTELAAVNIPIVFFCYGLYCPNYLTEGFFWTFMAVTLIVMRSKVPENFELKLRAPMRW